MKITGRRRIAVEAGGALLVLGAITGGIVAFAGDPKPTGPAEGSPEWVQTVDAKTRRSADLGRVYRDIIRGRGQEVTDALCTVEWGKLTNEKQADLDEYAFAGGCRMS
ncbi:hypothetical protein [Kitasatospora sp. NPDC057223]|uniref:hypothetical protein n=1 Tax=Kitasatospora sp. NPDC057223 TaxID=3346055 RepID=UPI003626CF27